MIEFENVRCRAIVDLGAVRANYAQVLESTGRGAAILSVVKADAYGHGALTVSQDLAFAGAGHFAVATLAEALELRNGGIGGAVLVLGGLEPGEERDAALAGVEPVIGSIEDLRRWDQAARDAGRRLSCHLLLNTGMNRLGLDFDPRDEASEAELVGVLRACEAVRLRGVATHYASAEDLASPQTAFQSRLFARQLRALRSSGVSPRYVHAANSAAVAYGGAAGPNSRIGATMVRVGLALYGYVKPPNGKPRARPLALRPALEWRARLQLVRDVPAGAPIGYGATFVAPERMRIGVLGVGYGDGLPWRLSNCGAVWLHGARCPIVGEISMDFTTVDLSAVADSAKVGDEAVLLGAEPYDAQEMAELAADSVYELLCGIAKRVPRQYVTEASDR